MRATRAPCAGGFRFAARSESRENSRLSGRAIDFASLRDSLLRPPPHPAVQWTLARVGEDDAARGRPAAPRWVGADTVVFEVLWVGHPQGRSARVRRPRSRGGVAGRVGRLGPGEHRCS